MRLPSLRRRTGKPQQPRPLPFTETQIRERAYKLWQANPEGSAEQHWDGAIEALKRERSLGWRVRQTLWLPFSLAGKVLRFWWQLPGHVVRVVRLAFTAETPGTALDLVKVVISAFGVLATVLAGVGLYLTYRTGQEQQRIAQEQQKIAQKQLESAQQERELNSERLVTDRFAKAVEQLGSQDIDVRIGAIYSLERIAKDSPRDHWTIMEVLTAFVRNKSPLPKDWQPNPKQTLPEVTTDVQSALTVIGRRLAANDPQRKHLDLNNTNLAGADLNGAKLNGANFRRANLSFAKLWGANLNDAELNDANLNEAKIGYADLSFANLEKANLSGANLENANLENANLYGAKLNGADISGANLESVGLETDQIRTAYGWQDAHYSPDFRQQLGRPPAKPNP